MDSFRLDSEIVSGLREHLPEVAERVVATVVNEVPEYADPFQGRMGQIIEGAVHLALAGFLDLAASDEGIAPGQRIQGVFEASYGLGRGEARAGRRMDALATAYRVGARRAWREMSRLVVARGLDAASIAHFAEMVFDYIDQLSDASVAGHADELASVGQIRLRRQERLADKLLTGDPTTELVAAAARAEWSPPPTLAALVLAEDRVPLLRSSFDPRALVPGDLPEALEASGHTVVFLPDAQGPGRRALRDLLIEESAVLGPARVWTNVRDSYSRAVRALNLGLSPARGRLIDTERHLAQLVVTSDQQALAELREHVLTPLGTASATSRAKLVETLRAYLLYQGRRDDIAQVLFVHPQTVRYRVGQLREYFGEQLNDPQFVLDATVALAAPSDGS